MVTKAMVMSAGMGSRLEPLTLLVPKPLVPVCNRPVMDISFEQLNEIGISKIVCNTYYLAEQIMSRYPDVSFIKEDELSGTAGGLKKCQFFFEEGEDLVVLSADGLTNADIKKGIEIHKKSGAIATIGVKRIDKSQVSHFGVVVTNKDGYVTEFQEKPSISEAKSDCINTGIYIFNYKIFNYIPANTFYDFAKNVFPKLLAEGEINTFEVNEYWSDIGTLNQYRQSVNDVFEGKCVFNHNEIRTTETGRYISKNQIDAKFIGNSTVGENCKIGKNVTIENSIIWDNVKIADNVYVKDCIVASGEIIACDECGKIIAAGKVVKV